jgi:hypothetical protein
MNVCIFITVAMGFMLVCSVITVAIIVILLRDFEPYGILFINVCCYDRCHGNIVKGFWSL